MKCLEQAALLFLTTCSAFCRCLMGANSPCERSRVAMPPPTGQGERTRRVRAGRMSSSHTVRGEVDGRGPGAAVMVMAEQC